MFSVFNIRHVPTAPQGLRARMWPTATGMPSAVQTEAELAEGPGKMEDGGLRQPVGQQGWSEWSFGERRTSTQHWLSTPQISPFSLQPGPVPGLPNAAGRDVAEPLLLLVVCSWTSSTSHAPTFLPTSLAPPSQAPWLFSSTSVCPSTQESPGALVCARSLLYLCPPAPLVSPPGPVALNTVCKLVTPKRRSPGQIHFLNSRSVNPARQLYMGLTGVFSLPRPKPSSSSSPATRPSRCLEWSLTPVSLSQHIYPVLLRFFIWLDPLDHRYQPSLDAHLLPGWLQGSANSSFRFYSFLLNTEARVTLLIYKFTPFLSKHSKTSYFTNGESQSS